MGQKAITIYTPEGTAAHITAEDDAFIHRCMLGGVSGVIGSLKDGEGKTYVGSPALPVKLYMRAYALFKKAGEQH